MERLLRLEATEVRHQLLALCRLAVVAVRLMPMDVLEALVVVVVVQVLWAERESQVKETTAVAEQELLGIKLAVAVVVLALSVQMPQEFRLVAQAEQVLSGMVRTTLVEVEALATATVERQQVELEA